MSMLLHGVAKEVPCAGRDNETDCVGRITESIWSRDGNAAHPKTWTRRGEVKPGLLLRLRTPHIDGERCPAEPMPDSTPARPTQTALSALQAQLEQKWSAHVRHSIRGNASADVRQQRGLSMSAARRRIMDQASATSEHDAVSALRHAWGIRPGTRTRRSLMRRDGDLAAATDSISTLLVEENVTSVSWFALVAATQPGWTPRDSSCPLFARKFAAATAGAVARAYATAVLPATSTNTAEHVGSWT